MIGFLQDMAAYVAQAYAGHPHVPHAEVLLDTLPGPLFHGNVGDKPEHCIFYDAFAALQASNEVHFPTQSFSSQSLVNLPICPWGQDSHVHCSFTKHMSMYVKSARQVMSLLMLLSTKTLRCKA